MTWRVPDASGRRCSTSLSTSASRVKARASSPTTLTHRSVCTSVAAARAIAFRCPTSASRILCKRSNGSSSWEGASSTRASAGRSAATRKAARSVSRALHWMKQPSLNEISRADVGRRRRTQGSMRRVVEEAPDRHHTREPTTTRTIPKILVTPLTSSLCTARTAHDPSQNGCTASAGSCACATRARRGPCDQDEAVVAGVVQPHQSGGQREADHAVRCAPSFRPTRTTRPVPATPSSSGTEQRSCSITLLLVDLCRVRAL